MLRLVTSVTQIIWTESLKFSCVQLSYSSVDMIRHIAFLLYFLRYRDDSILRSVCNIWLVKAHQVLRTFRLGISLRCTCGCVRELVGCAAHICFHKSLIFIYIIMRYQGFTEQIYLNFCFIYVLFKIILNFTISIQKI